MSAVLELDHSQNILRPMYDDDVPAVVAIENHSYDFPWSAGIVRDCLRVGYCCWVLDGPGGLDGYGIMSVAAGECHILNLCVRSTARGRGLGRLLLDKLLQLGRKHSATSAFLEVRPSNTIAIELYRGAGFNEVGLRRNYYPDFEGREDALILAREL